LLPFLWLAYTVWPFIELNRLATAVEARDVAALKKQVDFRALRASLTSQIVATHLRLTGKTGRPGSLLEQFVAGVGASIADPLVAKLISPEALLELLQNGKPSGVFAEDVPSIQGLSSEALGNVWRAYANSEFGIGRFFIVVPVDTPAGERFRLQFCLADWTWKLCGAELPEQLQVRLAREIINTEPR
jgi:Protein of unknown function (DUF2939)